MKLGSLRFIPAILAEWSENMGEHDGRDVEKEEEPRIESREKTISRKISGGRCCEQSETALNVCHRH